jgi:predicted RNase H-related nuclease YkuK (DUF458 family)
MNESEQNNKDLQSLQVEVRVLTEMQKRLERSVEGLEKLKQILLVTVSVLVVFGLGGGAIATYSVHRVVEMESRMSAIDQETTNSVKVINESLTSAITNINSYVETQKPILSQQAIDYVHQFGIKDVGFTENNGADIISHISPIISKPGSGTYWIHVGDKQYKYEDDNYLIITRP